MTEEIKDETYFRLKEEYLSELQRLEQENKRMSAILEGCGLGDNDDCSFCGVDKAYKELKQENKKLKEEIRFHNKENSILLAERNAAQIGYDEIREVRERYRSALEEINLILNELKQQYDYMTDYSEIKEIENKINEVLNAKS